MKVSVGKTLSCLYALAAFCACASVWATPSAAQEPFQQHVDYIIRINLDTETKMASGSETVQYTNNSPDTLSEFYLHLYPNAFRSKDSELYRYYARRFNWVIRDIPKDKRSYMNLHDVTVGGEPVTVDVDDTIAHLTLPQPLPPGGTMEIRLRFEGKVRKRFYRAGYVGNHYDFAQWYPKVVVYDQNGFHPDKHKAGEFYGEFGTFDVSIDLPSRFVVAATGTVVEGDPGWDYNNGGAIKKSDDASRKTVRFHAENVHDFAWCANPSFVVQDTTWNGIAVRSFYRKKNEGAWKDATLTHAVRSLEWLTEKVGPYPYPQLSIVDVPSNYGMEYPMLAMNGRASESLVLHEVGHVYFYGILGNDERAEAWLDEGFTTFQTTWYLNERYGPYGDTRNWNWYQKITPQYKLWEGYRQNVVDLYFRGYDERVSKRAEDFDNSYSVHVYNKAALFLNAIRYVTGDEDFAIILNNYYDRFKFKHVNEASFREICEEYAQTDLSNEFEQWLHTRKVVDYKLDEVKSQPRADGGFDVSVKIKRKGELFLPIEVVFELENGELQSFRVEGRLRTIEKTFQLPTKPKRTAINPKNEITDVDLRDNFKPRQRDFQVDWPNNFYYPEWGYQYRHRPGAWYNDVDGLKAGYLLRASYKGMAPRIRAGVYYGFLSERVDFTVRYEHPLELFDHRGLLHVSGYKMEGREDFTTFLRFRRRVKLMDPPTHEFIIGFNSHVLTDPDYLVAPDIYDTNQIDLGPYFTYNISPQIDVFSTRFDFDLKIGREWWGGDFKYERFTSTARFYSRPGFVPIDFRWRLFLGMMGGETPLQEKYQLAGAGPLEQEKHFWLRSSGAVPDWLNYHEGGDGNLRGYYGGTFGVDRLATTNIEAGTPLPLFALERITKPLVGPISWYGFYDVGAIMDENNPIPSSERVSELVDLGVLTWTLQDAGIGFMSRRKWPFWDLTLRLDFPIWVSYPIINGEEDKLKYRYLFSIRAAF
jgi:hypothetical protein